MPRVEDWFLDWALWVHEASARADYPVPGSEDGQSYWDILQAGFKRHGVDFATARAAAADVLVNNPFADAARKMILDRCREIQSEAVTQQRGQEPGSREAAKAATDPNCECGQQGLVIRFRPVSVGNGLGPNAAGYKLTCYCICPMGRWIRSRHDTDTRKTIVDLADHHELRLRPVSWSPEPDNPGRWHPNQWDVFSSSPRPSDHDYREDIAKLRAGMTMPRRRFGKRPPIEPADPSSAVPVSSRRRIDAPHVDPENRDEIPENEIDRSEPLEYSGEQSEEVAPEQASEDYDYL